MINVNFSLDLMSWIPIYAIGSAVCLVLAMSLAFRASIESDIGFGNGDPISWRFHFYSFLKQLKNPRKFNPYALFILMTLSWLGVVALLSDVVRDLYANYKSRKNDKHK